MPHHITHDLSDAGALVVARTLIMNIPERASIGFACWQYEGKQTISKRGCPASQAVTAFAV